MRYQTTPIMSFIARKGNKEIEADLGLLLRESKFGQSKTYLIFAECKTYNHFKKVDVNKMRLLGTE